MRYSDARVSYTVTTAASDAVLTAAREAFPELSFELNYDASRDDNWGECAADVPGDVDIPEHVIWFANREVTVEPAQGTVELVAPMAEALIADGWTVTRDALDSGQAPYLDLSYEGFHMRIYATPADSASEGAIARLRYGSSSPCLESPDDLADFDPDDPDAYFGPGSAPTVGPYDPPRTLSPAEMGWG